MDLTEEYFFINFKSQNKEIKYARQNYVNRRLSSKIFSWYDGCDIVGFTLNRNKTKVIRMFYNKHRRPEGDRVCESIYYPIRLRVFNPLYVNS